MTALGASMDVRFGIDVEAFMAYIDRLGLDHVELTTEYLEGHSDAPSPAEVGALADKYGVTLTYHAPFRDWNLGSFNDRSARAGVEQVKASLDAAAAASAGAVVVHGGDVPERYPDWVRAEARANAMDSLRKCADHAAAVGIPLCLENQPPHPRRERYTVTPDALAETIAEVGAGPETLRVTLDVGHANVAGVDWQRYVDRFGDRIEVCHLHDNDGSGDQHKPLREHEEIVDAVDATYNVFEMKSVSAVAQCVGADTEPDLSTR